MVKVLVIDDDPEILELLQVDLELLNFEVKTATNGMSGYQLAEQEPFDLILADVMMPRLDGYDLCKRLRANVSTQTTPIILLTAKGQLEDKVRGFHAGADDYLQKPFEFQELMVRMRALLRRSQLPAHGQTQLPVVEKEETLSAGDLRLLPTSLEAVVRGQLVKLTPTEFELLYCLMQHAGKPVPLATLLKEVWGYEADDDKRMIRVHMTGLRQKLEENPKDPKLIETVTHVGYRLNTTS